MQASWQMFYIGLEEETKFHAHFKFRLENSTAEY